MPRHPFRSVVYALVAQHAATVESVGADSIEAGGRSGRTSWHRGRCTRERFSRTSSQQPTS